MFFLETLTNSAEVEVADWLAESQRAGESPYSEESNANAPYSCESAP